MRFNKIFLAMIMLIVVSSIGIAAAEEASVGDHTFTVPDGYKVFNSTDVLTALMQDDDHVIVLLLSDDVQDSDDSRTYLEGKGYKFLGEESYVADGIDVQQQNYEKDGYTAMSYVIPVGDEQCIISYTIPSSETAPEGADNPVTTILKSIK